MNEHQPRHIETPNTPSDRSFGLVFAIFFLLVGLHPLLSAHAIRFWAVTMSGLMLLAAWAVPGWLAPFNRLWMQFGQVLHRIISPTILAILFFVIVTPNGLLMRLFGKDPLRLRMDKSANTYWINRTPPGPTAESLKNQF